jgi:hypothetical protein
MTDGKKPSKPEGKNADDIADMDTQNMTERSASSLATAAGGGGRLDPRVRHHIGKKIKAVYDEVLDEPVPDRFLSLLDELARKEREGE